MECVLQWLDNLDDLVNALRMQAESLRRICLALVTLIIGAAAAVGGAFLAALQPPLAFALASLLTVTVLYRGTVRGATELLRR